MANDVVVIRHYPEPVEVPCRECGQPTMTTLILPVGPLCSPCIFTRPVGRD